jgi:activator of HSP90 ATPase
VGGWHWTERDVLPWATARLAGLLGGVDLPGGFVTDKDVKVSGDATVNLRKGKLIPAYELSVSGSWKATGGESGVVSGTWALPYIADENGDEVPELTAALPPDAPPGADAARVAFLAAAKAGLATRVAPFVKEMAAGGPAAGEGEVKNGGGGGGAPAKAAAAGGGGGGGAKAAAPAQPPPPAADPSSSSTSTITRTERFYARRSDIWSALTDERRLAAATGAPAAVELRPGGAFNLYAGAVQAKVVEVDPPARLLLDWRFADWPEGALSRVTMDFSEPDAGTTVVSLRQTGVPTADKTGAAGTVERMEAGWRDMVFDRVRRVWGYGVGL